MDQHKKDLLVNKLANWLEDAELRALATWEKLKTNRAVEESSIKEREVQYYHSWPVGIKSAFKLKLDEEEALLTHFDMLTKTQVSEFSLSRILPARNKEGEDVIIPFHSIHSNLGECALMICTESASEFVFSESISEKTIVDSELLGFVQKLALVKNTFARKSYASEGYAELVYLGTEPPRGPEGDAERERLANIAKNTDLSGLTSRHTRHFLRGKDYD